MSATFTTHRSHQPGVHHTSIWTVAFMHDLFTHLSTPPTRENTYLAQQTLHLAHLAFFLDNNPALEALLPHLASHPASHHALHPASHFASRGQVFQAARRAIDYLLAVEEAMALAPESACSVRARLLSFAQNVGWKVLAVCAHSEAWR